jgi:CNT family concentrative nucleoside transporter
VVISAADAGVAFIFGPMIGDSSGPWGFIFAVKVLPIIIFFASFMSVLYYLGIMQVIVAAVAAVIRRTLGITGLESLSAAANIFLGQTEAPLCIKPYIATLTRSQLMCVMVCGFSTTAGSVLAAYVAMLGGESPEHRLLFAKHLIAAGVLSTFGGIVMAKIMLPETETPRDESLASLRAEPQKATNVIDAAALGATDGLHLALNVAAMLVAFVSLLALLNMTLTGISSIGIIHAALEGAGIPPLSFEYLLGVVFRPLAWLMGVPWNECSFFGSLLGTQIIATEFVAYINLSEAIKAGQVSPRTAQIAAYALCGFANLPSIAIQIGGLAAMAPERRKDLVAIGPRAMVAGALGCWITGAIVSIFIS